MPKKLKRTKAIDADYLRDHAKKMDEGDLSKALTKENAINKIVSNSKVLKRFYEDVIILFAMIKAYKNKEYRELPWTTISAVVFTLLYVFWPLDVIPDFIPGVGQLDDAAMVALCLKAIETDLLKFKEWQDTSK